MAAASRMQVPRRSLGQSSRLVVSAQGLGCMSMTTCYGPVKPESEMVELVRHAVLDCGVTFLDTAPLCGACTNEVLIGKAIKGIREKVQIATKCGCYRENGLVLTNGSPEFVRASCEASLKRLDVDYIDLYFQHRMDPTVSIEVSEMKRLVNEGKVKHIGPSEASASDIRRAHAVHPITAVQLEWSLWARDVEEEIIPTCRELGIGIVAYCPLGRGFFTGVKRQPSDIGDMDWRKPNAPRFASGNYETNIVFYNRLAEIAGAKKCTRVKLPSLVSNIKKTT